MKHMTKVSLVVVTATAVTFGGSMYAFADWIIDTPRAALKMRTAAMPAGNSPSVAKNGKNASIDWVGNKILAGVPAESYIVTRFGAGDPVVVCDHVTATTCKDKAVPGGTWTWKVQPVLKTWIGDHSADSVALTFSGPPPTAAALVSSTLPAAPTAVPVAPTGGSAPGSDTKAVTSPPAAPTTTDKPPAATVPQPDEPDAPPQVAEESAPVDPTPSVTPAEDKK
jgi:hypothetical protein